MPAKFRILQHDENNINEVGTTIFSDENTTDIAITIIA